DERRLKAGKAHEELPQDSPGASPVDKIPRPIAVPGVPFAPLRFDLGDVVADDAVPARKDGPVGPDLVKAGPAAVGKLRLLEPEQSAQDGPADPLVREIG